MKSTSNRDEAQLLTQGTEANFLKLAGKLDEAGKARWDKICKDFQRIKSMGGKDADSGQRIARDAVAQWMIEKLRADVSKLKGRDNK